MRALFWYAIYGGPPRITVTLTLDFHPVSYTATRVDRRIHSRQLIACNKPCAAIRTIGTKTVRNSSRRTAGTLFVRWHRIKYRAQSVISAVVTVSQFYSQTGPHEKIIGLSRQDERSPTFAWYDDGAIYWISRKKERDILDRNSPRTRLTTKWIILHEESSSHSRVYSLATLIIWNFYRALITLPPPVLTSSVVRCCINSE